MNLKYYFRPIYYNSKKTKGIRKTRFVAIRMESGFRKSANFLGRMNKEDENL